MRTVLFLALCLFAGLVSAATLLQRELSISTALIDATPTTEQRAAIVGAFVAQLTDDQIRARYGVERAALTNSQMADIYVRAMRLYVRQTVADHALRVANENAAAAAAAEAAAAGNGICSGPC